MSERLEKIKNRRKNYNPDLLPIWFEDMDWLIQQAERVPELEQALSFYGNKNNYENHKYWTIVHDGGKRARKALRGDTNASHTKNDCES